MHLEGGLIHVCPLASVERVVRTTGAMRLISLLDAGATMQRPNAIKESGHLFLGMDDVVGPREGRAAPTREQVERIIEFGEAWDREVPLVIHCYAGISRSTATAYVLIAALAPHRDEVELAQRLRTASPTAMPNPMIIKLADEILGRRGRMDKAIMGIGRAMPADVGVPFSLDVK